MITKIKNTGNKWVSLAALLLIAGCSVVYAHDFTVTLNGQRVYFNIKSKANKTAEVTYQGSIADRHVPKVEGVVEIPAKVKHEKVVYTITGIGAKAFCGADKLTGIILPASVRTISDFAFEGCASLSKIIFPGNNVSFGEGTFFKCSSIKDITFGSDWKSVDLEMFRWSDSLMSITIPAKVEKIREFKRLKSLTKITVDVNNSHFSSHNGVLYNKSGKIMYGCPRGYSGNLKIKDGTEIITNGALVDCPYITGIDYPESIKTFSFRETSRMKNLETLVFRGMSPVNTAYIGKDGKFVIQTINKNVKFIVSNKAKQAFKSVLFQEAGEYSEPNDTDATPYFVREEELLKTKNIIGVRDFTIYN